MSQKLDNFDPEADDFDAVVLSGETTKQWLQGLVSALLELFPEDWEPMEPIEVGHIFMSELLERLKGLNIDPDLKKAAMADFVTGTGIALGDIMLEIRQQRILQHAKKPERKKLH